MGRDVLSPTLNEYAIEKTAVVIEDCKKEQTKFTILFITTVVYCFPSKIFLKNKQRNIKMHDIITDR